MNELEALIKIADAHNKTFGEVRARLNILEKRFLELVEAHNRTVRILNTVTGGYDG